jgi:hypothetical protein
VSASTLQNQETALTVLTKALEEAGKQRARLGERIRQLAQRWSEPTDWQLSCAGAGATLPCVLSSPDDLRGDRFLTFLLAQTFRELVRGASEPLWNLSSRYRLQWHEEAFLHRRPR